MRSKKDFQVITEAYENNPIQGIELFEKLSPVDQKRFWEWLDWEELDVNHRIDIMNNLTTPPF